MVAAASVTGKEQTVTFPSWGVYSLETYKTLFLSWRTKVGEEHLLTQELDLLRWEMANLFRSWRPAFGEYQCKKIFIIQTHWNNNTGHHEWVLNTYCLLQTVATTADILFEEIILCVDPSITHSDGRRGFCCKVQFCSGPHRLSRAGFGGHPLFWVEAWVKADSGFI